MGTTKRMWFGPRHKERWVPAPDRDADTPKVGYASTIEFLFGGIGNRRSTYAHKEYDYAWDSADSDDLQVIVDAADGLWGEPPFYFTDPAAQRKNLLPQSWASPFQAGFDALPLFGDIRPALVDTLPNDLNYPVKSARYRCEGTSDRIYLPVPPGYEAWVGVHGMADVGAAVSIDVYEGGGLSGSVTTSMLDVSNPVRADLGINRVDYPDLSGIELYVSTPTLYHNYVPNPSFETNVGALGFTDGGSTAVGAVGQQLGGKFGLYSARLDFVNGTGAIPGAVLFMDVPVVAGRTYTFGAHIRTSIANRLGVAIAWKTSSKTDISTTGYTEFQTTAAATWAATVQRRTGTGWTAPSGAAYARVLIAHRSGTGFAAMPTNGWWEVDGLILTDYTFPGGTDWYRDGNSAGWRWLSTPNRSGSQQSGPSITLSGLMVQMLKIGETPEQGAFISGRGNAGVDFAEHPSLVTKNAVLDLSSLRVHLLETVAD